MQQNNSFTYQVATQYLSKIALRIEVLFERITAAMNGDEPAIHHLALLHLLELSKLIEKPELKSRFLKELMRFDYILSKRDVSLPETMNSTLQHQIHVLSHLSSRFGEKIHKTPFLQAVYTHHHQHHHDTEVDPLPLLYWLEQSPQYRKHDLHHWLEHLTDIYHTATLYLSIIRYCTPFETVLINHGFYQQAIHEKRTCHLIMLRLPNHIEWIPKIQFGHHGVTISLCDKLTLKDSHPSDIQFELAICQLH